MLRKERERVMVWVVLPMILGCAAFGLAQDTSGRFVLVGFVLLYIGFKILIRRADARRQREQQRSDVENRQR